MDVARGPTENREALSRFFTTVSGALYGPLFGGSGSDEPQVPFRLPPGQHATPLEIYTVVFTVFAAAFAVHASRVRMHFCPGIWQGDRT